MDAMTGALFVGASFVSSLISNKVQYKTEQAQIQIQTEQARLQTAEAAYERTKQFRQNLAANLALSSIGFGGTSGFRSTAGQNIADYFADTASLGRQDVFAQLTGTSNRALNKSKYFTGNVNSISNAASLAAQLGLFTPGKVK